VSASRSTTNYTREIDIIIIIIMHNNYTYLSLSLSLSLSLFSLFLSLCLCLSVCSPPLSFTLALPFRFALSDLRQLNPKFKAYLINRHNVSCGCLCVRLCPLCYVCERSV